ncbi:MAG: PA14 domain-containing protein, partial [Chloroflexi bacterium]|nr:PA14 domain-containing protein [Chloroflexota bacterium]
FAAGVYRFHTLADDGIRLWVDGNLVIDNWQRQGPTERTADIALSAGIHSLKVEYFEWIVGAVARVWWESIGGAPTPTQTSAPTATGAPVSTPTSTSTPAAQSTWLGEYFANDSLSGSPVLVRNDAVIDFDWGLGSPGPGVPPEDFSVRWTTNRRFSSGDYLFHTVTDDGVRLWVDSYLVIDSWYRQPPTERKARVALSAGVHSIKVEYFEWIVGAVARVWWEELD